jgi:hypothetical protein
MMVASLVEAVPMIAERTVSRESVLLTERNSGASNGCAAEAKFEENAAIVAIVAMMVFMVILKKINNEVKVSSFSSIIALMEFSHHRIAFLTVFLVSNRDRK